MARIKLTGSAVDAPHTQTKLIELRDTVAPRFQCEIRPVGRKRW